MGTVLQFLYSMRACKAKKAGNICLYEPFQGIEKNKKPVLLRVLFGIRGWQDWLLFCKMRPDLLLIQYFRDLFDHLVFFQPEFDLHTSGRVHIHFC